MAFSSNNFIFLFLPLYLLASRLLPLKIKKLTLLVFSVAFYYLGAGGKETLLFLGILAVNYGFLRLMGICKKAGARKFLLVTALVLDFGILGYYKYLDFCLGILNTSRDELMLNEVSAIPIGISFFTFQMASVLIDTYRSLKEKEKEMQVSALAYADCITAFPKLVSGPLVRYRDVEEDLEKPRAGRAELEEGFVWFVIGLGLKVILADTLAPVWENIRSIGYESISTPLAWLGALSYSLQLYFDFHGYSLMAMGIGMMTGLTIPRNFLHPYASASVTEFWRRWHITLGAWFRDYIYIPLGGSHHGKKRMIFSLFVVWLVTGLWHGAGWNFLLWGMIQFAFILAEKLFLQKPLGKARVLSHIYLIWIALQSWVVFAVENISDIGTYFLRLYPFLDKEERLIYALDYQPLLKSLWWVFLLAIFMCFPFTEEFLKKHNGKPFVVALELVVFWVSVYLITKNGSNPFMYLAF